MMRESSTKLPLNAAQLIAIATSIGPPVSGRISTQAPCPPAKENGGGVPPPQCQNMPAAEGEASPPPPPGIFGVNLNHFLIFYNPKFLIVMAIATIFIKNALEMSNFVNKFGWFLVNWHHMTNEIFHGKNSAIKAC